MVALARYADDIYRCPRLHFFESRDEVGDDRHLGRFPKGLKANLAREVAGGPGGRCRGGIRAGGCLSCCSRLGRGGWCIPTRCCYYTDDDQHANGQPPWL